MLPSKPHTMTRSRPVVQTDAATGISELVIPESSAVSVRGFLQCHSGLSMQIAEGRIEPLDASFHTEDDVQVEDVLEMTTPVEGRWRVKDVTPKLDLRGKVSHRRCELVKEQLR